MIFRKTFDRTIFNHYKKMKKKFIRQAINLRNKKQNILVSWEDYRHDPLEKNCIHRHYHVSTLSPQKCSKYEFNCALEPPEASEFHQKKCIPLSLTRDCTVCLVLFENSNTLNRSNEVPYHGSSLAQAHSYHSLTQKVRGRHTVV